MLIRVNSVPPQINSSLAARSEGIPSGDARPDLGRRRARIVMLETGGGRVRLVITGNTVFFV